VSGGLKRILLLWSVLALPLAALACTRGSDAETRRQTATLAEALRPAFFAEALGRSGGAHYHGTARFAAGVAAPDDGVTTTTDVWVDRARNYRLSETNDRDGGREVARAGRELFVALRYGKMIRRVAEEPEPTRLLEEALGAPWAAWEIVAPYAAIRPTQGPAGAGGAAVTEYALARAPAHTEDPAARDTAQGLRGWRAGVVVNDLQGRALVDDGTGALLGLDLTATFTTKREGRDLKGTIDVHGAVTDVGSTAAVTPPPAEDLALRQRIEPEQRELLGGLPSTRLPPAPSPRAAAHAQKSAAIPAPTALKLSKPPAVRTP
jgi:hypothetical protein